MENLIKALTIMLQYGNPEYATHCIHDNLLINCEINPDIVSPHDLDQLEKLGFSVTEEFGEKQFCSYKYGSY